MNKGVFVVGTGTDVGKTFVTALIVKAMRERGRKAAYYKAAVSGNARGADGKLIAGDAAYVRRVAGLTQPLETMCSYVYERAYSPHLAARIEGDPLELDRVVDAYAALSRAYDYIAVEGSGGVVCPLRCDSQQIYLVDVITALKLPCVLVADAGLGAINAVTLTVEYMRARGLKIGGLIFNRFVAGDPICEDNAVMCEKLTGVKAVARICENADALPFDPVTLYE